jgi:hypothetical protein
MASTIIDRLDGLSSSAAIKGPVTAATTANITLYGEQTIDGVAIVDGDRVLVKDQTAGYENGIYVADTGQWRRSKDFNRNRDVVEGTMVYVTGGTENEGTIWGVTTDDNDVGTSDIEFGQTITQRIRVTGGTYLRTLSNKLGDVLSADDFGVRKGVASDQSAAMNDMIDAIAQITASYSADLKQVQHEIDLGPGTIRLDNPIDEIPCGVRIRGRGAAATKFLAYGDFPVWSSQEFETDGVTKRYHNSMRFEDFAVISSDPANPSQAIRARGLIRNSAFERVGHQGCSVAFDIDESWTLQLLNCFGIGVTGQTDHHITLGATVGGIIINGGRYDVADEPHLYAVGSDALELFIINDAAFQFGLKGGIKVLSARTVRIHSAFLEGNCIGNPSEYYLDLNGSGSNLSSCEVLSTVMNNRADANRNGLGIAMIDNFETVEYRERWVRNGVKEIPIIGSGCTRAELFVQSATAITSAELLHLTGPNAASASAVVRQVARPIQNYGKELSTGNLSQTGTASFGRQGESSVMLGSRSSVATIQGHDGNTAKDLEINPAGGLTIVGATRKRLTSTASNYTPTTVNGAVSIDTSSGGRVVNLDLVTFTIPIGFTLTVFKTSGSNNVVFTPPVPTDTINGVAGNKAVASAGEYTLTKQTATAWLLSYKAFA